MGQPSTYTRCDLIFVTERVTMNEATRQIVLRIQRLFNEFDPLVTETATGAMPAYPPIFIVGAPRTGSTALFQVMLRSFRLAYISNAMALFPRFMVRLCRAYPRAASGYDGIIRESRSGYVPGLLSPNEAGKILRRWFDKGSLEQEVNYIRRTFELISEFTRAPTLFKNTNNSLRISTIRRVLPNSRFVLLTRDPMFTAQSLLLSRREMFGSDQRWFSVEPPGRDTVLGTSPLRQVLWQAMITQRIVEEAFADQPESLLRIRYEDFCDMPGRVLAELHAKLQIAWRDDAPRNPAPLRASRQVRLSVVEWMELESHYRDLLATDSSFAAIGNH
jgi:hypothetical protein